jgi:hypothetical protein
MQIMNYNPTYNPIRAKIDTFSCTETGQDQKLNFIHKQGGKSIPTLVEKGPLISVCNGL